MRCYLCRHCLWTTRLKRHDIFPIAAFPIFSAKTRGRAVKAPLEEPTGGGGGEELSEQADGEGLDKQPTLRVGFATRDGPLIPGYGSFHTAAEAVRRAAWLVDAPPDVLTTTRFVNEAREAAARLTNKGRAIEMSVLSGNELRDAGYGFLFAVGKAAVGRSMYRSQHVHVCMRMHTCMETVRMRP